MIVYSANIPQPATLILDIDGVLVDVNRSFRQLIIDATYIYLKEKLKLNLERKPFTRRHLQAFKDSGHFNSDWELTRAAVLCALHFYPSLPPPLPALRALLARCQQAGPGVRGVEKLLSCPQYDPREIEHLCMSLYAGEEAPRVFGVSPHPLAGRKPYYLRERLLIDEKLLPDGLNYAIVTGRSRGETELLLARLPRLKKLVGPNLVTSDSWKYHKPDPRVFAPLKITYPALYAGDTIDDLEAARRYQEGEMYFCAIAPTAERLRFFSKLKVELICNNINSLLLYLGRERQNVAESRA